MIGIKLKIVTDFRAIMYSNSKKTIQPQIARWFAILQEYDYMVEHRKGERVAHVDALNRDPVELSCDTNDYVYGKRWW